MNCESLRVKACANLLVNFNEDIISGLLDTTLTVFLRN